MDQSRTSEAAVISEAAISPLLPGVGGCVSLEVGEVEDEGEGDAEGVRDEEGAVLGFGDAVLTTLALGFVLGLAEFVGLAEALFGSDDEVADGAGDDGEPRVVR